MKIVTNIKFPKSEYPFEEMCVGNSFFVSGYTQKKLRSLQTICWDRSKISGRRYRARKVVKPLGVRVWRIPDNPDYSGFVIEEDIPYMPNKLTLGKLLGQMKINTSFFVPCVPSNKASMSILIRNRCHGYTWKLNGDKRFSIQYVSEESGFRVWRVE